MSNNAEVAILIQQLARMQQELDEKNQQIKLLSAENLKLENGFQSRACKKDGIYSVIRNSGKVVYGFFMYDENGKKIKAEAERLINVAKDTFNDFTYSIIAVSLYAGLREGECMGLCWKNIDFKNETISIEQQVQKVTKKRMKILLEKFPNLTEEQILITQRLKTEASRDIIVVPHQIIKILRNYKNKLVKNNQLNELCFCHNDGTPLVARDFVRYRFEPVLKKAFGSKNYMQFHELRGSCATILYMAGVPMKIIQGILRHGKMSVTEDIYVQIKKTSNLVAEKVNEAFNS